MIIDIHAHAAGAYGSAEAIRNMAEKYGLEKVVLCTSPRNNRTLREPPSLPFRQKPDSIYLMNRMNRFAYRHFIKDQGDGNPFVYELKRQLPELVIQFLWVDPLDRKQMDSLEEQIRIYQPKGIKLHQAWNPFRIGSPEFQKLAELAVSFQLPIFIHLYSRKDVFALLDFIRKNQKVVWIIGHLTGADLFHKSGVDLRNVYFDTSASDRISSSDIGYAIEIFGHEHVVFGSDTPYAGIEREIEKIEMLHLPADIKEHIYNLNAKKILSLS